MKIRTFIFIRAMLCMVILTGLFTGCKKSEPEKPANETGTMRDVQGNIYNTVKIGDQWWMAENLRVKCYSDSTLIREVKPGDHDSLWAKTEEGRFCNTDIRYGLHYNWFVIQNPKKIAPLGWHIPTDEEWKMLEMELGMDRSEADRTSWRGNKESEKLLPESSTGWPTTSSVFGTNECGFSALPGGCKLFNGDNGEVDRTAFWWTSSPVNIQTAWYRNLSSFHNQIFRYHVDKNYGLSIRCVKD